MFELLIWGYPLRIKNYLLKSRKYGIETRYEALLGFAESAENKALFTEMTGFG